MQLNVSFGCGSERACFLALFASVLGLFARQLFAGCYIIEHLAYTIDYVLYSQTLNKIVELRQLVY